MTFLPWMEIVGVVGEVKYDGLERDSSAAYYMPYTQNYARRAFLVVRSRGNAANLATAVRAEVRAADPEIVVGWVSTLEQAFSDSVAQPRFDAALLLLFAAVALMLAVIGIYGVMAYSVSQRTHEIGVRMALGASRSDVVRIVIRQAATLAFAGIVVGLVLARALTRLLTTLLFGVQPDDALTFAAVAVGLFCVALLASYLPARRATRISPVIALRYE